MIVSRAAASHTRRSFLKTCLATVASLRPLGSITTGKDRFAPDGRRQVPGPDHARIPISARYFGLQYNHHNEVDWPLIPFGSLRSIGSGDDTQGKYLNWMSMNPARGEYDWSIFDPWLDRAASRGVDIIFTLHGTPPWAVKRPTKHASGMADGYADPPDDITDWMNFVAAVAKRAAGRIQFWEVWNEPDLLFSWTGTLDQMVSMAQAAHKVIKDVDPSLQMLSPPPFFGGKADAEPWRGQNPWEGYYGASWMEDYLSRGGGQYADILAFHGYQHLPVEQILTVIQHFQKLRTSFGMLDKPLWNTEAGFDPGKYSPAEYASMVAKTYLLNWSGGVERFYWYSYDNRWHGTLWRPHAGLNAGGWAYKKVYEWMVGATMTEPISVNGTVWSGTLRRPERYKALVAWDTAGTSQFRVSPSFTTVQTLNGTKRKINNGTVTLSNEPVLIATRSGG